VLDLQVGADGPALVLEGELNVPVIEMNEEAYARLRCGKEIRIGPGASHLFAEPGTLEEVARLAAEWFQKRSRPRSNAAGGT
jgi:putative phosphoribosyl transferase